LEQGASTLGQALIGQTMIDQALIATWVLVAVAFIALVILVYVAVRNRTRRVDLEETVQAFRSLDIEAFRNLVDPAEEAFLRHRLPPGKFREIKRRRAWAALLYAWEAGKAAAALAKVGQAAQRSPDPEVAASGVQVTENAFRLRLQTVRVSLRLLTEVLLPGLSTGSLPSLADQYQRAAETLFCLGRLPSGVHKLVRSKTA
jgi:hypothetical protein